MSNLINVAVVGSSGAVGEELLRVLERRNFPVGQLYLFSSSRSAGRKQRFGSQEYTIRELKEDSFHNRKIDLALFSAGGNISRRYAPLAVSAGATVIDNSSAFRMDPSVPLVIPEINAAELPKHKGIVAVPNCSTIIMLMAIFPIHQLSPLKKIVVSTYQAASGAGAAAMQELEKQSRDYLEGRPVEAQVLPHVIAFNAFSHNSAVDGQSGYNGEEQKMIDESHKILQTDTISITPTCIRIGAFRAHAESIHLELTKAVSLKQVRRALAAFPGLQLVDDRSNNHFPMPLESSGRDEVLVGRLRYSPLSPPSPSMSTSASISAANSSHTNSSPTVTEDAATSGCEINLWCCGDQILKGAALNAVQIAEQLLLTATVSSAKN